MESLRSLCPIFPLSLYTVLILELVLFQRSRSTGVYFHCPSQLLCQLQPVSLARASSGDGVPDLCSEPDLCFLFTSEHWFLIVSPVVVELNGRLQY